MVKKILLSALLVVCFSGFSSACTSPKVTSKSLAARDATSVGYIGFIVEFAVQCESGQLTRLRAKTEDGSGSPVTDLGAQTFQVSWTEKAETARPGQRKIRIFDEEGATAIRRAMRYKKPSSSVPEFFSFTVNYLGDYKQQHDVKLPINSRFF